MFLRISERMVSSKSSEKLSDDIKTCYDNFVVDVGRHFLASLFDGASFSRRGVALECLEKLFKIFGPVPRLASADDNAEVLFRCLEDSFDKNCLMAVDILNYFPANVTKMDDPVFVQAMW